MSGSQGTFNEAFRLHQSGRFGEAITLYTRLLSVRENDGQLLYLLGTACQQIGRPDAAIEFLTRAVSVLPGNPFAHNNRGNVQVELKRLDEALACFDKAIALKPDYADAFNNRPRRRSHPRTLYVLRHRCRRRSRGHLE